MPRAARCATSAVSSTPSNITEPDVGSIRRVTQRAVVLLPHPDSPTIDSTSPRLTSNDTPDTACTIDGRPSPRGAPQHELLDEVADRRATGRRWRRSLGHVEPSAASAGFIGSTSHTTLVGPQVVLRRVRHVAGVDGVPAPWRERAADGIVEQRRGSAADRHQLALGTIEARQRLQQRRRVRVLRAVEGVDRRRRLDDLAGVHHVHDGRRARRRRRGRG